VRRGPWLNLVQPFGRSLVRAYDERAAWPQRARETATGLPLELLAVIGEDDVSAEDEVEGTVGGAGAEVVAEEGDRLSVLGP
jgi:hypothetical protein